MCYNGHLGDIGITGTEPEWERNVIALRNDMLNAFYDAASVGSGIDIEKIVDSEFKEVDNHIYMIIDKLKNIY